jgi:hypothetical protein
MGRQTRFDSLVQMASGSNAAEAEAWCKRAETPAGTSAGPRYRLPDVVRSQCRSSRDVPWEARQLAG